MRPKAEPAMCEAPPVKGRVDEVGIALVGEPAPVPVGYGAEVAVPFVGTYEAEAVAARAATTEMIEKRMVALVGEMIVQWWIIED